MKDSCIGFIGLGNVGEKVANNILKSKYNLFIFDKNIKKGKKLIKNGAEWCNSLSEIASKSTIIITCLPSPITVREVLNNILPYLNKKHLWIEMSTTDESEMIQLSNLCLSKKVQTLEAPLTGGQHRAKSGNIAILVGGSKKNFNRAFPILSLIGYKILHCGKIGNASTLKVVTNYLASINLLALGEALMVCKKYGLSLNTAFHGIRISSGNSFVNETETKVILSGSYNVGFTMDLVCKDVALFDKLTDKFTIPAEISKLMNKTFLRGKKKYGDRSLSTSIVKLIEESCKENLRAKGFPKELIDLNKKKKGIEIKI